MNTLALLGIIVSGVVAWFTVRKSSTSERVPGELPKLPPSGQLVDFDQIRYFTRQEFDSKGRDTAGISTGHLMHARFVLLLDKIRHEWGRPLIINSGYRTEIHNTAVGGSPTSSHMKGLAADIHMDSYGDMLAFVSLAKSWGITRIGLYRTLRSWFVHIDLDEIKPDSVWHEWRGERMTPQQFAESAMATPGNTLAALPAFRLY